MLNLFAHYVAVNKNWFETADESKYWGKLFLSEEDWEVPPPPWAITSEKNMEFFFHDLQVSKLCMTWFLFAVDVYQTI